MAIVPITKPYSMKAATFEVVDDDFTAAVSQVQFDPSTSATTWKGIGGNTIRDQSPSEWTMQLGFAQDLAPGGLARYLHDNEGQKKAVTLTPVETGPAITCVVVVGPGSIGGTADGNTATASVSLPCDGKPVFVDA